MGTVGFRERAVLSFRRVSTRLTVARLKPVAFAMRTPVQHWRRSCSMRAACSVEMRRGERCGREDKSRKAEEPPSRKRRTHLAADCRLSLNSAAAEFKLNSPAK